MSDKCDRSLDTIFLGISQALRHSHVCKYACSEELPELKDMGGPVQGRWEI